MRWIRAAVTVLANAMMKALLVFALILLFVWPAHSYETTYPAKVSDKKLFHSFVESAASVKTTSRIFADGFEPDEPGGPVPFTCDHPDVAPSWMVGKQMLWSKLFTPRDGAPVPTYPNSNGFPVPIGADRGGWEAGKFVALPDQTVNMVWDGAQANRNEGYGTARPAEGMFISISPCAGDLRAASFLATDFLAPGCRKFSNEGTLRLTTRQGTASTFGYCALTAGQTYYITVSPVNPDNGLDPGEHTCRDVPSSQSGCDCQARSNAN